MGDAERTLIHEALRFAVWAAGEGIAPAKGEDARGPEDFLLDYSLETDETDWETLPERLSALSPAPKAQQEPVAWRWKPKDSAAWIYNPKPEWLEAQSRDEIDAEPLYTRPSEQAVTQAMVRAAAEILIGRVNAPEQEIYTATRDALKAAMEARNAE